jgi:hypothetical protein
MEKKLTSDGINCCTPKGQLRRYVNCKGCDNKPIHMENKLTAVEWFLNEPQRMLYFIGNDMLQAYNQAIVMEKEQSKITEDTSDGYHTFKELYEFRKVYNAALFNEWAKQAKYRVHKSWRHHDGELCFGGGWFIVVAILPSGQISNHYEAKDWELFQIMETEKAIYPFDGHTPSDVIQRITQTYGK